MEKNIRNIFIFIFISLILFFAGFFVGGAVNGNQDAVAKLEYTSRQLDSVAAGFAEYRRQSTEIYQQFRSEIANLRQDAREGEEIIRTLLERLKKSQDAFRELKKTNIRLEEIIFGKSN